MESNRKKTLRDITKMNDAELDEEIYNFLEENESRKLIKKLTLAVLYEASDMLEDESKELISEVFTYDKFSSLENLFKKHSKNPRFSRITPSSLPPSSSYTPSNYGSSSYKPSSASTSNYLPVSGNYSKSYSTGYTPFNKFQSFSEPEPEVKPYSDTATFDDYRPVIWTRNSCYFVTAMHFLWTIIPFRKYIETIDSDHHVFKPIKDVFDRFSASNEKYLDISQGLYLNVFNSFVRRNVGERTVQYGDQETAAHLVQTVIEHLETHNPDLYNSLINHHRICVECKDGSNRNDKTEETIAVQLSSLDGLNPMIEEFNREECRFKDLGLMNATRTEEIVINTEHEYLILEFTSPQYLGNINVIDLHDSRYLIKNIIYHATGSVDKYGNNLGESGHYISYVFDDDGWNPFILDDQKTASGNGKVLYVDDLRYIQANSLVLYRKVTKNK